MHSAEHRQPDDAPIALDATESTARAFLRLMLDVVSLARDIDDPAQLTRACLELCCNVLKRPVGIAWDIENEGELVRFEHAVDFQKIETSEFIEMHHNLVYNKDESWFSKVVDTQRTDWKTNLASAEKVSRRDAALAAGFKSVCVVPIRSEKRLIALFELFGRKTDDFDASVRDLLDQVGSYIGIVLERKIAEVSMKANERKYRMILDRTFSAFVGMDPRGCVVDWNKAAEKLFGYTRDEVLGRSLSELIIPSELRERHELGLARFLRTGENTIQNREIQMDVLSKSGERFPIRLGMFPLHLGSGIVVGAFIHDLREKVAAQRTIEVYRSELTSRERLMDAVLDSMAEAVWVTDVVGNIILANPAGERLAGSALNYADAPENFAARYGCYLSDGVTPFPLDQMPATRALKGESTDEQEMFVRNEELPNGIFLSFNARPLRDVHDNIIGSIVVAHDVTTRRRMQQQLQATADQAMESTRLKSQFVANVSHEIRTPLAGVLGMAELLTTREDTDDETRTIASYILESAENLLTVVNDLLDFSKLEAGKVVLHKHWFSPSSVLAGVRTSISINAAKKNLDLGVTIDPSMPPQLYGDEGRITQILLNFAHNAVKFTASGSIKLSAHLESKSAGTATIRFAVDDTGIGIKPEAQANLFQPFVQADGSTTRRFGGTGLGLSIAKKLTELMGGEVGLTSSEGEGSTFWCVVPLSMHEDDY